MDKAYTVLLTLELGSIGIKYEGSGTNPFQQSTPTTLLFLTAISCHAVASMADMSLPTTMVIFHVSGVVGCETMLWILLPEFWSWYLINLFVLVVTSLCFFNKLFCGTGTPSNAVHVPNLEGTGTPSHVVHVPNLEGTGTPSSNVVHVPNLEPPEAQA